MGFRGSRVQIPPSRFWKALSHNNLERSPAPFIPQCEWGWGIPLIGDAVSVGEIAELVSGVLGRQIPYREISDDKWAQNISAAGLSSTVVEHLVHLWRFISFARELRNSRADMRSLVTSLASVGNLRSR
jgi:hypothetical protein